MLADVWEMSRQRLLRRLLANRQELFQESYYADQCGREALTGLSPLEHYIQIGSRRNCPAHPTMDVGRIVEDMLTAPATLDGTVVANMFPGLDNVPDEVYRELGAWSRHFPELNPKAFRPPLDPGAMSVRAERLGKAFSALRDAIGSSFTHLVVAPWHYHPGGAERIGLLLMRYLRDMVGAANVVMYAADLPTVHNVDLPSDTRLVSLCDVLDSPTLEERVEMLDRLIIEFAPRVVFNLHSESCWQLFARHGATLHHNTGLYGIVFSNAVSPEGEPYGYSYELPGCIGAMRAVIADNSSVRRDLARHLPLLKRDVGKIHVVYTPAPPGMTMKRPRRNKPRQSLWMSRFADEKRMDVLAAIAARMPHRRHLVYGSLVQSRRPASLDLLDALGNVEVRGRYASLSDIPADSCDAFLYTSTFDGLPIVFLEATAMGLPIVAPDVGGIGDFVTEETGWLVSGSEAVDEYVAALCEIEENPELACRKVHAAQRLVRERHGWERFASSLASLPGFIETSLVEE
ncbi:MAG: glycosyltransferase family 4 protein [Rhizobiaceae bacterium]|nr:glycosyltransferase family 4 protein [Rhizobiaceae bacterium]